MYIYIHKYVHTRVHTVKSTIMANQHSCTQGSSTPVVERWGRCPTGVGAVLISAMVDLWEQFFGFKK